MAGVIGLVLVVVAAVFLVKGVVGEASNVAASSTPEATAEPTYTYTYTPEPTPTLTPSEEPTTEEPFNTADLDSKATDPTPITVGALLPDSFTSAKGVQYNLKASCTKIVSGAYVNPNATKNSRITAGASSTAVTG